jgi:polysaccharide biosynthesis/export protein
MDKKAWLVLFTSLLILVGCSHIEKEEQDAKIEVPAEMLSPVESESESSKSELTPVESPITLPEPTEKLKIPSPSSPYRLNIGDTLEISVLDEPEMTRDVKIIPDGSLTYLLVGEIPAQGKTIKELRDALTKALEEYFVAPYVSVLTKELFLPPEEENRVSILGALKNPGNFQWHQGDRVLDIIAEAGGLLYTQTEFGSRTTANLKAAYLSRNGKTVDVDFFRLLQLGDMEQNILLEPNDFVYIADAEDSNIVVMGEVNSPKIIPFTRDISLIEALSMSGGFTREAYQSRVVILRTFQEDTKYLEVNVNDLLYGRDVRNIQLESGDIIFVPEQGISEYSRYANFISNMFEVVIKGYELREAIRFPKLSRDD